jgi:hypothetical protein
MSYKWFLKTKDIDKIYFFYINLSDEDITSPFELKEFIQSFDYKEYWSISTTDNTFKLYKIDPNNKNCILIPKKDVIKIWSEKYEPQNIIDELNINYICYFDENNIPESIDTDQAIEEMINVLYEADLEFIYTIYKQVCHSNVKIDFENNKLIKLEE